MAACLTWQQLVEHHLHLICTARRSTPLQAPLHQLREGNDHSGIILHTASDSTDVANKHDHPKESWCGQCSSPYAASVCRLQLPWHWRLTAEWQFDKCIIQRYNHIQLSLRMHGRISLVAFHSDWWNSGRASALEPSTVTCSQEWFCRSLLQQNVYK